MMMVMSATFVVATVTLGFAFQLAIILAFIILIVPRTAAIHTVIFVLMVTQFEILVGDAFHCVIGCESLLTDGGGEHE